MKFKLIHTFFSSLLDFVVNTNTSKSNSKLVMQATERMEIKHKTEYYTKEEDDGDDRRKKK